VHFGVIHLLHDPRTLDDANPAMLSVHIGPYEAKLQSA
jgi:hypothetical protein